MISSASTSAICSGRGNPNPGLVGLKPPVCPPTRRKNASFLRHYSCAAPTVSPARCVLSLQSLLPHSQGAGSPRPLSSARTVGRGNDHPTRLSGWRFAGSWIRASGNAASRHSGEETSGGYSYATEWHLNPFIYKHRRYVTPKTIGEIVDVVERAVERLTGDYEQPERTKRKGPAADRNEGPVRS
jgi:hypothetical protein